jgi:hypothetical protein
MKLISAFENMTSPLETLKAFGAKVEKFFTENLFKPIQKVFGWISGIVNSVFKEIEEAFAKIGEFFSKVWDDAKNLLGLGDEPATTQDGPATTQDGPTTTNARGDGSGGSEFQENRPGIRQIEDLGKQDPVDKLFNEQASVSFGNININVDAQGQDDPAAIADETRKAFGDTLAEELRRQQLNRGLVG